MESARAPSPLPKIGNSYQNWNKWKQQFLTFLKVTDHIKKTDREKSNLLKCLIGPVGLDAIETFSFDHPHDKNKFDLLLEKLDLYFCKPQTNEVMERYYFFVRSKKSGESIEKYIDALKEQAKSCNFGQMTASLIRDKIIFDTKDHILRKKYFKTKDLDLQKIITIYTDYENSFTKMKEFFDGDNKANTHEISSVRQPRDFGRNKGCCWRCGQKHPWGQCTAIGSKCTDCNQFNHLTGRCKYAPKKNGKMEHNKERNNANSHTLSNTTENLKSAGTGPSCEAYKYSNCAVEPKFHPSAPPLPQVYNTLYPNLDHIIAEEIDRTQHVYVPIREHWGRSNTPPKPTELVKTTNEQTKKTGKKDSECVIS